MSKDLTVHNALGSLKFDPKALPKVEAPLPTAEELAYHIAAHAKHGDHFVVAKAWAEYPTAAIDAAKESA